MRLQTSTQFFLIKIEPKAMASPMSSLKSYTNPFATQENR